MGVEPRKPSLLRRGTSLYHPFMLREGTFTPLWIIVEFHNRMGYYVAQTTTEMLCPPNRDQRLGPVHCVLTSTTETPFCNKKRYLLTTEIANLVHDEVYHISLPRL